jgi:NADPH-dependent 2,4-dienoyl-CoA reductase/sulfur reductase-like enzyme
VIKKVTIVGGGPAGMETARVAAKRGHEVTLFEKNDRLGGQLIYAVLPPHKKEWKSTIDYLTTQVQKMKMTIRLGEEATPKKIKETVPDALVIATGAEYVLSDIPGIHGANVVTPIQVLTGERKVGRNVVIVGGGSIGCETAEFLSGHNKKILILEMMPTIAADLGPYNRWLMIERLIENDVRVETGVRVEEITDKGVRAVRPFCAHDEFFEADTVVVATGNRPVESLVTAMKTEVPELHIIGDAVSPRRVKEAIEEGFLTALKI